MRLRVIIASVILSCFSLFLQAQDVEKLPDDPRIKTGKLANGLTYYIFRNGGEKGHADFILAQKFGESIEDKDQSGMLRMLELLATRGTRNFADSTINQYFKSLGLANEDVKFITESDKTVYSIRNVPVTNTNTIDSTLLVLYNWINSINIDEEDIDSAYLLYKNKMLNHWDAFNRLNYKANKDLYTKKRDSYSYEPYPWESKIKKFSSKELRNFYYKTFTPDKQAIIVVGDIDSTSIRTRITSLFSTIPKAGKQNKKRTDSLDVSNKSKIVIVKDKEYNKTSISIDFIKSSLPAKYKLTSVPYIQEYMNNAIAKLLLDRIEEGIISKTLPIWNVKIQQKDLDGLNGKEQFSVTFETLPNTIYSALNFLSLEIDRMAKFGFNGQEFISSKDLYFKELENLYDSRFVKDNDLFTKRVLDNYYYGYSLASIEMKFELMKQILFSITHSQLNDYASALLGKKEDIRIICKMPDISTIETISKERLLSTFMESLATSTTQYNNRGIVRWPKFLGELSRVSIEEQENDPLTGTYIFTLSNGVRVLFKQTSTSKDTVSFKAVSKGGFSLMEGVNLSNEKYINNLANLGGIENISQPNLNKIYSYNNMDITARILPNTEELYGYGSKNNLETLFNAIYLNFSSMRVDEAAFDIFKKEKLFENIYNQLSPVKVFTDSVIYYNNSNKKYVGSISNEDIQNLNYSKFFNQIKQRYSNAADFDFIFAGNVDHQLIKDLSIKYLGALKTNPNAKETWYVVPNYLSKGELNKSFLYQMIVPRSFVNKTNSMACKLELENVILAKITQEYLRLKILNSPIKDISPSITVSTKLLSFPENIFVLNANFVSDSAGAYRLDKIYDDILHNLALEDVDFIQFDKIKNQVRAEFIASRNGNNFWLNILEFRAVYEKDFYSDFLQTLESISTEKFRTFVKELVISGNSIGVFMEGTTEDVKTKNLFRENKFIKDFFNY